MSRRTFLQVVGLSAATNSLFTEETEASPTQQNPDTITTGFPTIDEALQGGWRKGTVNTIYAKRNCGRSLLLQSMAIKAATDLKRPASVAYVTSRRKTLGNDKTPFDGCMTIIDADPRVCHQAFPRFLVPYQAFDLVVFESKEIIHAADSQYLLSIAQNFNCAIVIGFSTDGFIPFIPCVSNIDNSRVVLAYSDNLLCVYKNVNRPSSGPQFPLLQLTRPSLHFYEEKGRVAELKHFPRKEFFKLP